MSRDASSVSATELQVALTVLSVVIWVFAAYNSFAPGMYYRTGPFKGADFVHFYALGHVVTEGRADLLYDRDALEAAQSRLVPVSEGYRFIPVYGPQTALLFAGLAKLPYLWAALVWGLLTISACVACVWTIWRRCPSLGAYTGLMLPAALGFIPLYVLATSGQTSVLPLLCLTGACLAFKTDRKWWAGVALGSLVIKPHFGLAAAIVMLACREWRVIAGALTAVAVQWGLAALCLGAAPLAAYFGMLRKAAGLAGILEPEMGLQHSLRAFWLLLLPWPPLASTLYALTSAAVLVLAVRVWRGPAAVDYRYSALALATLLVSPHMGTYDLVLVAPAAVLTANAARAVAGKARGALQGVLCAAYLAPVTIPLTDVSHLQMTTVALAAWFLVLCWAAAASAPGRTHALDHRPT